MFFEKTKRSGKKETETTAAALLCPKRALRLGAVHSRAFGPVYSLGADNSADAVQSVLKPSARLP